MNNKKTIRVFSILICFGIIIIFIINKLQISHVSKKPDLTQRAYCLEEYLKKNKNDIDSLLELGLTYHNNNQLDKAEEAYLRALNINSNIDMAWHRLGNVYTESLKFDKAILAYSKSIELEPSNPSSYFLLSQVLLLDDVDKAKDMTKKYVQASKLANEENWEFVEGYSTLINQLDNKKTPESICKIYLKLIKSDFISFDEVKIQLINNIINSYGSDENKYIKELITIKDELQK